MNVASAASVPFAAGSAPEEEMSCVSTPEEMSRELPPDEVVSQIRQLFAESPAGLGRFTKPSQGQTLTSDGDSLTSDGQT